MNGIEGTSPIPGRYPVRERSASGQQGDAEAFREKLAEQETPSDRATPDDNSSPKAAGNSEVNPIAAAQERARLRAAQRKTSAGADPHGQHVDVVA